MSKSLLKTELYLSKKRHQKYSKGGRAKPKEGCKFSGNGDLLIPTIYCIWKCPKRDELEVPDVKLPRL